MRILRLVEAVAKSNGQVGIHKKYNGPLCVEWEDIGMDREHGAREACEFVKKLDFELSGVAFDAVFSGS